MFELKELWLKNFRSYKDLHLDISNLGLALINGSNGSGKTSIMYAIEYLLTDTISADISVDEFTFNKEGNCELGCIIHKENDVIKIIKYRDHKKNGNSTILEFNGDSESYTENDRRQTQKNIEKMLGITKEFLSITSIFSQDSLSFPKCKESDRKKILYDALELHKYTEKFNKAKDKINSIEKEMDKARGEADYIARSVEDSKEKIKKLEYKSKEWEKDRVNDIKKMEDEIEHVNNTKLYDLDKLKEDKEKFLKTIEEYRDKISGINKLIYDMNFNAEEKDDLLFDQDALKKSIIKDGFELAKANKELEKLQGGICPLLKDKCDRLLEKENDIKKDIFKHIEYTESVSEKNQKDLERVERLLDSCKETEKLLKNYNDKIKSLENNIDILKLEIQHIEESISKAMSESIEKKERVLKIKKAIQKKTQEEDPYISIIIDEELYIGNKELEIDALGFLFKELNEKLKYMEFLKIAYSKAGIPNMKMEGFLESLEIETNKILSSISDKLYITINSQGETKSGQVREKIDYLVHHPDKTITNFYSYSGGERQRVRIADMMAFQRLLGKFNFMILDEILELSLDSSGKNDIVRLLKAKLEDVDNLFVISHDQEIKDGFNTVINIKKVDGVSHVS